MCFTVLSQSRHLLSKRPEKASIPYSPCRANESDLFKRWLSVGVQDLGEPVVVELLLDWLDPFLTVEEHDRLAGWHLGVSLYTNGG